MTDTPSTPFTTSGLKNLVPDLPLVIWMVLLTIVLDLAAGRDADEVIGEFNTGFGWALGEFALILLPSFTLAAALARQNIASNAASRTVALASPIAGAGMICPDTAYAALSPAAGRYKLDTAFGAYAGFKLLYPAGPLIVAAGLGVTGAQGIEPTMLLLCGAVLTLPVWLAGVIWGRFAITIAPATIEPESAKGNGQLLVIFAPFLVMAGLLVLGDVVGPTGIGSIDFALLPKGALIIAAILALLQTPSDKRRECLDSAVPAHGIAALDHRCSKRFWCCVDGACSSGRVGATRRWGADLNYSLCYHRLVQTGAGILDGDVCCHRACRGPDCLGQRCQ